MADCNIVYCQEPATYVVEIDGFFKQVMCDKHTDLMYKAISNNGWFGAERISS